MTDNRRLRRFFEKKCFLSVYVLWTRERSSWRRERRITSAWLYCKYWTLRHKY